MPTIGGCRAQKEPGHGGLSTYETFILWLKFNSLSHFFLSWQQGLPGHSPGMPWPAATYDAHSIIVITVHDQRSEPPHFYYLFSALEYIHMLILKSTHKLNHKIWKFH